MMSLNNRIVIQILFYLLKIWISQCNSFWWEEQECYESHEWKSFISYTASGSNNIDTYILDQVPKSFVKDDFWPRSSFIKASTAYHNGGTGGWQEGMILFQAQKVPAAPLCLSLILQLLQLTLMWKQENHHIQTFLPRSGTRHSPGRTPCLRSIYWNQQVARSLFDQCSPLSLVEECRGLTLIGRELHSASNSSDLTLRWRTLCSTQQVH